MIYMNLVILVFNVKSLPYGSDGTIRRTDFYMIHTFEDSELRLLIDGILASRHITASQRKDFN